MMGEREGQVSQQLQLYPALPWDRFCLLWRAFSSLCSQGGEAVYSGASPGPDPEVLSASE